MRVDITRFKTKLLRESRPALVGKCHVLPGAFVFLRPVKQSQLELRHAFQKIGVDLAVHFLLHIGNDLGDALITANIVKICQRFSNNRFAFCMFLQILRSQHSHFGYGILIID